MLVGFYSTHSAANACLQDYGKSVEVTKCCEILGQVMEEGFSFKSTLFDIHVGEDEETNPGVYGKELANWLSTRLREAGYDTEIVAEDWGWCVVCERDQYLLWAGCGATYEGWDEDANYDPGIPPQGADVIWHVFPVIEVPLFYIRSFVKNLVGQLDTESPLEELRQQLEHILSAEENIRL